MGNVKVSVICLVYNHEKYLRQCLEGFVNQKCNFEYEVLIHDDASTDNSAAIIREYEEKFPNIIKPIYQTENQTSKGIKVSKTYLFPKAKGEYVAWCEGDDYWIDEYKLQKQVDFLDSNENYSACAHCTKRNYIGENKVEITPNITADCDYSAEEVILLAAGVTFCTNSLMMRTHLIFDMPSCFYAKGFSDYQMYMYAAMNGKFHCLKDVMSVYNYGTNGSCTDRLRKNKDKKIAFYNEIIRMLLEVDEYYNGKYSKAINDVIDMYQFNIMMTEENYKEAKMKYKKLWKKHKKGRFRARLKRMFPWLILFIRKIRQNGSNVKGR